MAKVDRIVQDGIPIVISYVHITASGNEPFALVQRHAHIYGEHQRRPSDSVHLIWWKLVNWKQRDKVVEFLGYSNGVIEVLEVLLSISEILAVELVSQLFLLVLSFAKELVLKTLLFQFLDFTLAFIFNSLDTVG